MHVKQIHEIKKKGNKRKISAFANTIETLAYKFHLLQSLETRHFEDSMFKVLHYVKMNDWIYICAEECLYSVISSLFVKEDYLLS